MTVMTKYLMTKSPTRRQLVNWLIADFCAITGYDKLERFTGYEKLARFNRNVDILNIWQFVYALDERGFKPDDFLTPDGRDALHSLNAIAKWGHEFPLFHRPGWQHRSPWRYVLALCRLKLIYRYNSFYDEFVTTRKKPRKLHRQFRKLYRKLIAVP